MKVFNVEIKYLFNIESRTKTKSESIREESNLTRIRWTFRNNSQKCIKYYRTFSKKFIS